MNINDTAVPCVEPAPDVNLVVSFGGQTRVVKLRAGGEETVEFGNFPVKLEVTSVERKRVRPAGKPPYYWIIKTSSWNDRIRAMTEENARRLFYQRFRTDEDIVEIYPEIS